MAQKSLIGELPKILEYGRREAGRILERLSDSVRVGLQTNELVLPAKDVDGLFKGRVPNMGGPQSSAAVFGDLFFSHKEHKEHKDSASLRENDSEMERVIVELGNYVLLSPDNIPLDEKDKATLAEVAAKDPLALIEYWSVDPDFNGETFRSLWQDYRENTENDGDPDHCVRTAEIVVPAKPKGTRVVCVKAVDVFGFESVATVRV